MPTLQALAERFDCDLAALYSEIDIPVLTGVQRQGDVLVLPATPPCRWPKDAEPLRGQDVTRWSENEHAAYGDGQVLLIRSAQRARWWARVGNVVGWLRVPDGGQAFLMHAEHGALGIGPGVYEIRTQWGHDPRGFWYPARD